MVDDFTLEDEKHLLSSIPMSQPANISTPSTSQCSSFPSQAPILPMSPLPIPEFPSPFLSLSSLLTISTPELPNVPALPVSVAMAPLLPLPSQCPLPDLLDFSALMGPLPVTMNQPGFAFPSLADPLCAGQSHCSQNSRDMSAESKSCRAHEGRKRCQDDSCTKLDKGGGHCIAHGGGKRCQFEGCDKLNVGGGYCIRHGGGKRCQSPGCSKADAGGGSCVAHGGGRRCSVEGCNKLDKGGGNCRAHGGAKRCQVEGCEKLDKGGGLCLAHGGGRRCTIGSCPKLDVGGGKCYSHGGGKRCRHEDCSKSDAGGGFCVSHGGGRRCRHENCDAMQVRNGYCKQHVQLQPCRFSECPGTALPTDGKFCIEHKDIPHCKVKSCSRLLESQEMKYCNEHAQSDEENYFCPLDRCCNTGAVGRYCRTHGCGMYGRMVSKKRLLSDIGSDGKPLEGSAVDALRPTGQVDGGSPPACRNVSTDVAAGACVAVKTEEPDSPCVNASCSTEVWQNSITYTMCNCGLNPTPKPSEVPSEADAARWLCELRNLPQEHPTGWP